MFPPRNILLNFIFCSLVDSFFLLGPNGFHIDQEKRAIISVIDASTFKHETKQIQSLEKKTALISLGNRSNLPLFHLLTTTMSGMKNELLSKPNILSQSVHVVYFKTKKY